MARDKEQAAAEAMFAQSGGPLHIEWTLDLYWTQVAKRVLIPGLIAVHAALVKKRRTAGSKSNWWGDADGQLYYIPHKTRKIIVFTTGSYDYLIVLSPSKGRTANTSGWDLDIRRVWRAWNAAAKKSFREREFDLTKPSEIVSAGEWLSDYEDENDDRPGLAFYAKIDYVFDHEVPFGQGLSLYGDSRDPGYVLSYRHWRECAGVSATERTIGVWTHLVHISTIYLGVMAYEVEAPPALVPHLPGYSL